MYFLLHHAKGALILDAASMDQVLSWMERQLGGHAKASSVLALEEPLPDGWVEKSGTGIRLAREGGCEAMLSFTADSVQRVVGLDNVEVLFSEWCRVAKLRNRKATVH